MLKPFHYPSQSTRSDPIASRWHLWAEQPPDPAGGPVRCRRGGVESLVDAGCRDPGWPLSGVLWEETGRCKPLRMAA